jgi:hypothetical protein
MVPDLKEKKHMQHESKLYEDCPKFVLMGGFFLGVGKMQDSDLNGSMSGHFSFP